MNIKVLLRPHANPRYREQEQKLALRELEFMAQRVCPDAEILPDCFFDRESVLLKTPQPLGEAARAHLAHLSMLYGALEADENGRYAPILSPAPCAIGEDLPGILKYKGKTNEQFTALLINLALYASDYWNTPGLTLADPMCARGTTLFEALNRGYHAYGGDVDRNDLNEAEKFFKRYLEFHRFKHSFKQMNFTLPHKKSAPCAVFTLPERNNQTLNLVHVDAIHFSSIFSRKKAHLIVCDLPYGVQHNAKGTSLKALLAQVLPVWHDCLAHGGAIALSYNAQTLKKTDVLRALEDAGFELAQPQMDFSHWVEQAVTRDVAVAVRRK